MVWLETVQVNGAVPPPDVTHGVEIQPLNDPVSPGRTFTCTLTIAPAGEMPEPVNVLFQSVAPCVLETEPANTGGVDGDGVGVAEGAALGDAVGVALGTEAHLVGLRRTASGPFTLEGAVDLDAVAREVTGRDDVDWKTAFRAPDRSQRLPWRPRDVVAGLLERGLRPMRDVLGHLGWLELDDVAWGKLRTGQLPRVRPDGVGEGDVYLMGQGDAVAALARWEGDKPRAIVVLIGVG